MKVILLLMVQNHYFALQVEQVRWYNIIPQSLLITLHQSLTVRNEHVERQRVFLGGQFDRSHGISSKMAYLTVWIVLTRNQCKMTIVDLLSTCTFY